MNCKDAKELIDLLVHDSSEDAREIKTPAQWAELDAHLAACPQCRSEFNELRRARALLGTLAADRPTDREIESMWSAISSPVIAPIDLLKISPNGWWSRNRSLVVSLVGAAAVLLLAFQLGNLRYAEQTKRYASASNTKGIGRSAKIYADENESKWGAVAHDVSQFLSPSLNTSPETQSGFQFDSASGLGVDARYLAGAKSKFVPPPASPAPEIPAEADALEKLSSLGYVSGPPARAGSAPANRRARGGTGNTDAPEHLRLQQQQMQQMQMVKSPAKQILSDDTAAQWNIEQLNPPGEFEPEDTEGGAKVYGFSAGGMDVIAQEGSASSGKPTQNAPRQNLKIIKTGELGIEVPTYAEAVERVDKIIEQFGAFVADASTREEAGGALVGRIVIRTAPERFEEIFAALKAVGRVESENVKAADVTAEYVDTEARIHSLKITEERLRELIANKSFVDKIASLLEVERELNRVRTEIEKFEGQLRLMADRVALSTITLTIREPGRTVPAASLSVEVITLEEEATQKLADLLAKTGSRLVSAKTTKRDDGTLMGNFQLETTLAHFAEVISGIEALGRVQERHVSDQQFGKSEEPWAQHVKCAIALVLFERLRQLPSGAVRLEVDELDDAMKSLDKILQSHDATIASNQANRLSNGSDAAEIHIRVPAGEFADLVEALASLGRTISKTVSGEAGRVVGGAAVVPCDLTLTLAEEPREVPQGAMNLEVTSFETARQALSRAIGEHEVQVLHSSSNQRPDETWQGSFRLGVPAREMEDFVKTVDTLGRVAARQISGLGLGDLSRTDPDALGVIELTMSEKSTLVPATSETTASIRARVRDGLEGFYASMGLIAYGLVVLLPWLVLALLLGWIVARIHRRNRRHRAAQAQAG